jgi:N4-gp56 family major capsid protein
MIITYFNLQLFADAGTLVSTSTQYVNAYTGATTAFDSVNTLSGELKTFYDTELLENARAEMFYAQFAKRQPLPANRGTTVEWRKWNTFAKADRLTEGVIPTGQKFGMSSKTGVIYQYGTYATISDRLELRAYDDIILGATEEMGASAAETQETLIRDALAVNTNVLYCDRINTSSNNAYVDTPTTEYGVTPTATAFSLLTPDMVAKAVTKLKKDRAPMIGGKYYAVVHPSVAYNLRKYSDWLDAHKYAAPEQIFNGEIGELHGCRFIENVFAPILRAADLASDSRTLKVNYTSGYSGAITSVTFDGGTVAADELIGRKILINGIQITVTDNTTTTITFASTNFGSVADDTVIYPGEAGGEGSSIYYTYFFGRDGFGIIDPEGGALEMIVKDRGQIGGPIEQYSTVGYKFETNGATILYTDRVLRAVSCTSYSGIDVAN